MIVSGLGTNKCISEQTAQLSYFCALMRVDYIGYLLNLNNRLHIIGIIYVLFRNAFYWFFFSLNCSKISETLARHQSAGYHPLIQQMVDQL